VQGGGCEGGGGVSARRRRCEEGGGGGCKCEWGGASVRGGGQVQWGRGVGGGGGGGGGGGASLKVCCFTSCHYCSPIVFLAYPFVQCTCTYT
jgi:hypothetical protein